MKIYRYLAGSGVVKNEQVDDEHKKNKHTHNRTRVRNYRAVFISFILFPSHCRPRAPRHLQNAKEYFISGPNYIGIVRGGLPLPIHLLEWSPRTARWMDRHRHAIPRFTFRAKANIGVCEHFICAQTTGKWDGQTLTEGPLNGNR